MTSESLTERLENEFTCDARNQIPGEHQSAGVLPIGRDAVASSGFPSSVAVPATTTGEIRNQAKSVDIPRDSQGRTDTKTLAQQGKE